MEKQRIHECERCGIRWPKHFVITKTVGEYRKPAIIMMYSLDKEGEVLKKTIKTGGFSEVYGLCMRCHRRSSVLIYDYRLSNFN